MGLRRSWLHWQQLDDSNVGNCRVESISDGDQTPLWLSGYGSHCQDTDNSAITLFGPINCHSTHSNFSEFVTPWNRQIITLKLYTHIHVLFPNAGLSLQLEHRSLSSVVLFSRFPTTRVKIPLQH